MGPEGIAFLRDLSRNNNRDWFNTNKKRYENELKKPWEELVTKMIGVLGEYEDLGDLTAKQTIFRIYRDTRFSKDKTPYKTHVSAVITPGGRKNKEQPGFYVHLDAGMLMLGGGAYFLDRPMLRQVRQHMALHPTQFRSAITNPDFVEKFGEVQGDRNKIIPKEFKPVFAKEPLIALKQVYFMSEHPAETVLQSDFLDTVRAHYQAAQPLNQFLQNALTA